MKRTVILGSTGSIGTQALEVAAALPEEIRIVGLAAGRNFELLAEQIRRWNPEVAVLFDETNFAEFRSVVGATQTRLLCGLEGILEAATWPNCDVVLGAMLGAAGLKPTLAAIEADHDVAIANKETLVAAGEIVMRAARGKGVNLWPVDSEHCALAQCLMGEQIEDVEKLTLTASGGPFRTWSREQICQVNPKDALKHPTWTMGRKITIDSATLVNKGLEMIEAHHLFGVPMQQIEVVVHPQSLVHSFVSFRDGSVKAQIGAPDMKMPIGWGLLAGKRADGPAPKLDLAKMGNMTFESPDADRFPALNLARRAMEIGGVAPAMFNAANEIAVEAFLNEQTSFYGITNCIERVLEKADSGASQNSGTDLDAILEADARARRLASELLATGS